MNDQAATSHLRFHTNTNDWASVDVDWVTSTPSLTQRVMEALGGGPRDTSRAGDFDICHFE